MIISCQMEHTMGTMHHRALGDAKSPAIVLVAFGASSPEARKVYDHIDQLARRRYPGHAIYWAFTSRIIVGKLNAQGMELKNEEEILREVAAKGHKAAAIEPLLIVPGQEYDLVRKANTSGLRMAYGAPLLADADDIKTVAAALAPEIKPGIPNVIVCHGNKTYDQYNRELESFAGVVEKRDVNVLVCSVEGRLKEGKLERAHDMAQKTGAVHFVPLMLVAGQHVMSDVMGDEPESWKSQVGARQATCAGPLGENDKILELYFKHLDKAL
jgi:sirohydrochlorin cobaltochelatase